MNTVVLLLGGNQGNTIEHIVNANIKIQQTVGEIIQESSFYESEPWGFNTDQWFINKVIVIRTALLPHNVLSETQLIEKEMGRTRSSNQYTDRPIDIDILFFDNLIHTDEKLTIPHPKLHLRRFTLLPLIEIMPQYIHPSLKRRISDIYVECNDPLKVNKIL